MAQRQTPPIQVKPSNGGRLMAGLSAEAAGIQNYIVKRDFRRYKDREMRAEGHERFCLNRLLDAGIQAVPNGSNVPPTVIANARRGDGKKVVVAGNPTTLWVYTGTEDTNYITNNDYFVDAYVDTTQNGWRVIASKLSPNGRRWEAVQVGDYLCFNNGVDLPLTYRPGDSQAMPIYELREQQIASVGTICEHSGNLLCMDLWIINDTNFAALMAPISGDYTNFVPNPAQYAAFTDTTKMQRFPTRILPSYPGQPRRFGATVPVQAKLGDRQLIFKYPIRSLPELVWLNNASGLTTTTLAGGSTDITVLFANTGGGTLTTSVIGIQDGIAMSCLIWDAVGNPISFSGDATLSSSLEASDAANSYAGTYIDIIGMGGAILKGLALRTNIIVYKDVEEIWIGTFTGDLAAPYTFDRVKLADEGQALAFRNVIISAGGGYYGSYHLYAGRNAFYKWDLFQQTPQEVPELQVVEDLFFDHAVADKENAWAAENPLTREWYFAWKDTGGQDRALCLDYAFKTVRTTTATVTCGQKIQHPTRGDWMFVFGADDGSIQRYGLYDAAEEKPQGITLTVGNATVTASAAYFTVDHVGKTIVLATGDKLAIVGYVSPTMVKILGLAPNTTGAAAFQVWPGIWHRNGQPYDSVIESGDGDMGDADSEKLVNRYVLIASSMSQNAQVNLDFKAGLNPDSTTTVQSAVITMPQNGHNLIEPTFIGYYVGGRITVSDLNAPFELVNQVWQVAPIGSKSAGRI